MIDELLAFIAPHHCYLCQKTGLILCDCCKNYILQQAQVKRFDYATYQQNGQVFFIDNNQSIIKAMIYDYKLNCRRAYARVFAQIIAEYLPNDFNLVIVPAPTIAKSRRQRGFGHVELIAQELVGLGYDSQQLLTNSSRLAQKDLDAQSRYQNIKNNLVCSGVVDAYRHYLVIDDITTTGATLQTARQVLRRAGAQQVACLALIHA